MKRKQKRLLVIISLLIAITVVIVGINSWDQKIQRSGAEATELLESEGIKVRTVDTSQFQEQAETPKENPTTDNQTTETETQPAKTNPSTPTSNNEPSSPDADTKPDSQVSMNDTDPSSSPTTNEDSKTSMVEIKEKYLLQFLELEDEITSRLTKILEEAIQDYETKQENNKEINLADFQRVYATKIVNLEQESDRRFAEIYQQFEDKLIENNYPKSEAAPYQAKYRAEKQNRERVAVEKLQQLR